MDNSTALEPLFTYLSHALSLLETNFYRLPGSHVVARYVRSSYRNDPGRSLLELILVVFAIRTLLQSRTKTDSSGKHFIQYSEKEIDELVDEWTPEPLGAPLTPDEESDLASTPIIVGPNGPKPKLSTGAVVTNLASYNFAGLANNEVIKQRSIEVLRKYGVGSCGPPGFYGTVDLHMDLERDIADFLGTEGSILYSQDFSTISSVIPAFAKRGDVIVADRGVKFAIQKGLQISRSTIRWYDHNDLQSLHDVLLAVEKERKKKKWPLTRRFIVTEGIFEQDGAMVDLPKLVELKKRYKYRLILDEGISFGTVGRTGRGLTELYNVPATEIDMLVGSVANGLQSSGGFCAGARHVVEHQRINGTSFVFSAAGPALLAASASSAISILRSTPSILTTLHDNIRLLRSVLDKLDSILIPSHPASPIIHLYIRSPTDLPTSAFNHASPSHSNGNGSNGNGNGSGLLAAPPSYAHGSKPSNPTSIHPHSPPPFDLILEEKLCQEIVDECLAAGVWVVRAKRLRGQEWVEPRPSVRIAVSAGVGRREVEKAAGVVKAAVGRVLGRRR